MASLEQKILSEIDKLTEQIGACRRGEEGLKFEYISARGAYTHILSELKGSEVSEKRKYGYDIPEDNVRTNGFIEVLENRIKYLETSIGHESMRGEMVIRGQVIELKDAIRTYRNYLDKKEG
jgi:hypothetical protein